MATKRKAGHKRGQPMKNPHAVALGLMGGAKGGHTRASKMTPEERSEAARKAVLARWAQAKTKKQGKEL